MMKQALVLILAFVTAAQSLTIDTSSSSSVCKAASLIADGLLDYYEGTKYGGTVGMFQEPYYWWQAGEAFGALLNYKKYCKNDTYDDLVYTAITSQLGDNYDLMVSNFSSSEGNDDQGVWALTIMQAAEMGYKAPKKASWAQVAVNTFNVMFQRWDNNCGGGIRWQIFENNNNGFGYKNSISNGGLMTLAARLAKYYDNKRYAYIAGFIWDWTEKVGFLQESDTEIIIYDGGNIENACQDRTEKHWTYNYGMYLMGSAYLYNYTGSSFWLHKCEKLLTSIENTFFDDNDIMYEEQCQTSTKITCNDDQRSFKAILARALGSTNVLVPSLSSKISTLVQKSAKAAAASCSGGSDNHTCGLSWRDSDWDGLYGFGEQLNALEMLQATLAHN